MKSIKFLIAILLFQASTVFAQNSNLVIFSEQGEKFSVVLNGILQNSAPQTNVRVTGLTAPSYKLKVIFDNDGIPDIDKNIMVGENTEMTFCIKKNNKGEYVARFMNQVDIMNAPPALPAQTVVVYTTVPPPVVNTTVNQTSTTTTINAGAPGMSVTMNVGGTGMTTTTTTTTTTSSSQMIGSGDIHQDNGRHEEPKPYVMPGYNGPIGCPYPMTDLDFQNVKETIASKNFEDSKLTIAKQVVSSTCLFSSEVKEIIELFDFESTRLEFAKYAYRYTFDLGNYYKINSAFQFESSIDELNEYITRNR